MSIFIQLKNPSNFCPVLYNPILIGVFYNLFILSVGADSNFVVKFIATLYQYTNMLTLLLRNFLTFLQKYYTETIIWYEYKLSIKKVQFSMYHKVRGHGIEYKYCYHLFLIIGVTVCQDTFCSKRIFFIIYTTSIYIYICIRLYIYIIYD